MGETRQVLPPWATLIFAFLSFGSALALLTLPQLGTHVANIATISCISSLATLAGLSFGIYVISASHVALVAALAPIVYTSPIGGVESTVGCVALCIATLSIFILHRTLPFLFATVVPRAPAFFHSTAFRRVSSFVTVAPLLLWILLP